MVKYREILRLRELSYTQRQIAASVQSSRNTVSDVIKLADMYGLKWPLDGAMTDKALQKLLYPDRETLSDRHEPDYAYIHSELAKEDVTLTLLWSEYCDSSRAAGKSPYMLTHRPPSSG
jgi:transposase